MHFPSLVAQPHVESVVFWFLSVCESRGRNYKKMWMRQRFFFSERWSGRCAFRSKPLRATSIILVSWGRSKKQGLSFSKNFKNLKKQRFSFLKNFQKLKSTVFIFCKLYKTQKQGFNFLQTFNKEKNTELVFWKV